MWCCGPSFSPRLASRTFLERKVAEGENPVGKAEKDVKVSRVLPPGYGVGNWEASTSNRKYVESPIVYKYREGTLKRTHNRESKEPET